MLRDAIRHSHTIHKSVASPCLTFGTSAPIAQCLADWEVERTRADLAARLRVTCEGTRNPQGLSTPLRGADLLPLRLYWNRC